MAKQTSESLTILVVDDDDASRSIVRDAISQCKVSNSVFEARNGQEAMELLKRAGKGAGMPRPGLIYLDVEMPGMDGHTTLKQIKADPQLRDIPVVMMTGVSSAAQMRAATAAGANSYTLKPANAEQFLRTVLASTNYRLRIHS